MFGRWLSLFNLNFESLARDDNVQFQGWSSIASTDIQKSM